MNSSYKAIKKHFRLSLKMKWLYMLDEILISFNKEKAELCEREKTKCDLCNFVPYL